MTHPTAGFGQTFPSPRRASASAALIARRSSALHEDASPAAFACMTDCSGGAPAHSHAGSRFYPGAYGLSLLRSISRIGVPGKSKSWRSALVR